MVWWLIVDDCVTLWWLMWDWRRWYVANSRWLCYMVMINVRLKKMVCGGKVVREEEIKGQLGFGFLAYNFCLFSFISFSFYFFILPIFVLNLFRLLSRVFFSPLFIFLGFLLEKDKLKLKKKYLNIFILFSSWKMNYNLEMLWSKINLFPFLTRVESLSKSFPILSKSLFFFLFV